MLFNQVNSKALFLSVIQIWKAFSWIVPVDMPPLRLPFSGEREKFFHFSLKPLNNL